MCYNNCSYFNRYTEHCTFRPSFGQVRPCEVEEDFDEEVTAYVEQKKRHLDNSRAIYNSDIASGFDDALASLCAL